MKRMTCKQVQSVLVDYIESELPVHQRKSMKDHISECMECTQEFNGLREMLKNAKELSIPEPGDKFWETLPQRVLEDVKVQKAAMESGENVIIMNQAKTSKNQGNQATSTKPSGRASWLLKTLPIAATVLLAISAVFLFPSGNNIKFDSLSFQHQISTAQGLPVLVSKFIPIQEMSARYGFSDQGQQVNTFVIGSLFAETLALLSAGYNANGAKHLDLLVDDLSSMEVDSQLITQVSGIRNIVKEGNKPRISLRQFAAFQVDFEQYLKDQKGEDAKEIVLFRMGAWTVDFGLAAVANNKNLLKQEEKLDYFKQELERIEAPIGAINTLNNISHIVTQDNISDRNTESLFQMVQKLRGLLG